MTFSQARTSKKQLKKFRLRPRFPHKRSEGLTRRRNGGSFLQTGKEAFHAEGTEASGDGPPRSG